MEDYFFELFEILDGTAEKFYEIITNKFNELRIPYKTNMIGLAADGANVMMGKNNSLATKFKQVTTPVCYEMCMPFCASCSV